MVIAAVVWALGFLFGGGLAALGVALVVAGVSSGAAWWSSDRVALAMSHAHPADEAEQARLHNIVEGLCIAGGLPKPKVYVIEDPAPNAFATGRDPRHAAIAVTTGLLDRMNRIELEGVVAHELSHVKNRDTLVGTLAVTMVGVVVLLADFGLRFMWWGGPRHRNDMGSGSGRASHPLALLGLVLLVLAPLSARLMQRAVSRRRESLADVTAVTLTRYPPGLISALEKLRDDPTVVHSASLATAHLWIESPLDRAADDRYGRFTRLFDTHPPLEERIAALREL